MKKPAKPPKPYPSDVSDEEWPFVVPYLTLISLDQSVTLAYVDQGYTGENARAAAQSQGIALEVVKHTEAKRGFILLPRRRVVERSFAWAARFRRLARDYERLSQTLAGFHYLAFACLMLHRITRLSQVHNRL